MRKNKIMRLLGVLCILLIGVTVFFLMKEETGEPEKPTVQEELWTIKDLNLMEKPDADSKTIMLIPCGESVQKHFENGSWAYVQYKDNHGYVKAKYLTDAKPKKETDATLTEKEDVSSEEKKEGNGYIVVIDPGHQRGSNSKTEPNGPGSSTMKACVAVGTTGVSTGVAEYILNLDISVKLKAELENRGYTVYMTRTTHDTMISNIERAEYANNLGADAVVRIHANGFLNASVRGAEALAPSSQNSYVSHLAQESQKLSRCILDAYCAATGFGNRGVITSDTMTGINWSKVPVTILEMGYMTNAEEDQQMQDPAMQERMVQGIANGLDVYFDIK